MNVEPEREPGRCPHCGATVETYGEAPGETPYWACPEAHTPRFVVLPPRDLGYATALVAGRLYDPIREQDRLEPLDADAPDPGRFLERVCERLALKSSGIREADAERRRPDVDDDPAAAGTQFGLDAFAGGGE
ncbi:hypothetical protein [Halostella litorea]|uniref:hypothetical protein n=1 Tax=Halostella litorea TaxID=2528831 RepID=UPI00109279CF|nr:hypothetical protein [Halostella litorea]